MEEKYYQGAPCKYGHDGWRYTVSRGCVQCTRERSQAERKAGRVASKSRDNAGTVFGRSGKMYWQARARAKRKGVEFSLTREWIRERLELGVCELTGLSFFLERDDSSRTSPYAPSIDRRDSAGGYTPDNCRVVLWGINTGLSDWGEDEYARIACAYLGHCNSASGAVK